MRWRKSEKRHRWRNNTRNPDEFGNRKSYKNRSSGYIARSKFRGSRRFRKDMMREPEPLIDIFQDNDGIAVIAELKGFKRENVKVHADKRRLVLSASASGRSYYKSLNLPIAVIPESMRITYKNGVLEVRLKKALEKAIKEVAG
ncbi:MAG: Hsp20/alpha crystallin family protein [Candidatus Bathyarchaeota archaeon]|nr:Hsp20/alpha crystallin family protein [Candidatus Bathyarchaeota archaeon]MCX8176890.1 Hsp20/alpha crystallin family protein [Candidatus Bathyarchaeota archaeon]MDW8193425.1 Hsp20/alpha crystallin family protein [Nitrososphaerota archaeon]